ncbi:DUF262 domain-containing protein [Mucilaginibacter rubeus]|uniref:DUF262 domain-containing protein n=1 Tax=Mucilaginibacter rubeus TaxID=2027860 RepID=UPI0016654C70|nr:DUF262 domain-containing protein [Mucilaginibacter rubeus]GGA95996.1 hypothetical protein GCM10011500_09710 [Mucilaginibacter rubeus]
MRFTFYELLNNYQVSIPLIQRDYAQGRETAGTIRKNFVSKLKQVLSEPSSDGIDEGRLHLDFVYGYTEGKDLFVPLDGQQRLTTLFLLHWYIAVKEQKFNTLNEDADSVLLLKQLLSRFTYKTRLSSQRFCDRLVNRSVSYAAGKLSAGIIDQPWFMSAWQDDPTIQSMLSMLDAIHESFQTTSGIWSKLTSKDSITFEFIDIKSEQFRLTDELYIKMNSRGKALTPFENFKAEFIDLLAQSDYKNERLPYEGVAVSYKDYFSIKADGKWMDLFWDKRMTVNVDNGTINYLSYITEMLYYKDRTEADAFVFEDAVKDVYGKQENTLFLFRSLDVLSGLSATRDFFGEIFSNKGSYIPGRVSLFETGSTDLFERSLNGASFDIRNRILLYALLHYIITFGVEDLDRLKDFIRIVRNLLTRVRQVNSRKRIEFTSNLRLPDFHEYSEFIHGFTSEIKVNDGKRIYEVLAGYSGKGFTRGVLSPEQYKTGFLLKDDSNKMAIQRLEDHPELQGITDNLDFEQTDIPLLAETFYQTWNPEVHNSRIIRGMLTCGDFSIQTHNGSRLGDIWYFGSAGNWGRILTTGFEKEQASIRPILNTFLSSLSALRGTTTEKLNALIDGYHGAMDFRYYFIKYYQLTAHIYETFNLFTWADDLGFDVNSLGNSGQHPLASYHINPYLIAVENLLNHKKVTLIPGRFSDGISHLRLKGRVQIYCQQKGWLVQELQKGRVTPEMIEQYRLQSVGKNYLLQEEEGVDRIQSLVQLCQELLQS